MCGRVQVLVPLVGCRVPAMQMWHLTQEVTVTGDNGGGQAVAATLLLQLFIPTCLIYGQREFAHRSDVCCISVQISLVTSHPFVQHNGCPGAGREYLTSLLNVQSRTRPAINIAVFSACQALLHLYVPWCPHRHINPNPQLLSQPRLH